MTTKEPTSDAPVRIPSNPGEGLEARIVIEEDDGKRSTEVFNMVEAVEAILRSNKHEVELGEYHLKHVASGFLITPAIVSVADLDDGRFSTTTTIQINHPELFPDGIFEYQHFTGSTISEALIGGINQWYQTDFAPLLEIQHATPKTCTTWEMDLKDEATRTSRTRRAIFGPLIWYRDVKPEHEEPEDSGHTVCPCCMFTSSIKQFQELVKSQSVCCVRLFVLRDADGSIEADCRVNGEDYPQGAQALTEYAGSWKNHGFEFRKQYVVLHNLESPKKTRRLWRKK